jgi:UDP-N-acetylmuramate: L-alanyl-gamma-D-glutamyl-meso-diaminopimelate ligase
MNIFQRGATKIRSIYLLGIGGAAMAPVAGMLKESGYEVRGSDTGVYPPASTLLSALGVLWCEGFRAENLRPAPDLVVVGNVIARGNPELEEILERKIPYASMAALLEEFFLPGHHNIVVVGTHGKTTTTAMLAWIFHSAARRPDFLVGGVLPNFDGRSYGLGGGAEFIIEGDEYETAFFDRGPKFMHYHPDELVLTSCEFDHGDIYADLPAIELQFQRLVNLVPRNGKIVAWGESDAVRRCVAKAFCPLETYSVSGETDWTARGVEWKDERTHFTAVFRGREVVRMSMSLAGAHNVANALAATAIADGRGIAGADIERAMATFEGVRRRMEVKGEAGGVLVVEDFAHHPTAIRATIEAARTRWPGRKLWAAVEPRSNTMRRNIFKAELPNALSEADAVVLGPVNRAQLLADDERLDPQSVAEAVRKRSKAAWALESTQEIVELLSREMKAGDVVLVMSNGSFDGLCARLLDALGNGAGGSK